MHDFLKDFWKWANKSPEEYGKSGMNQNKGEFEDDFPLFENLITYAKTIVDNNEIEPNLIDDLLNIMALDNESENILDYIEDKSSDEQLKVIVKLGLLHLQYNARWQLAELLYRRRPENWKIHLNELSNDEHPYVRKRALNCIELLNNDG